MKDQQKFRYALDAYSGDDPVEIPTSLEPSVVAVPRASIVSCCLSLLVHMRLLVLAAGS